MILIFACLALLASGCGGDSDDGRVDVVTTTTIAADIVRHVAGPDADVDVLLPESASPHDFALSAKDRARLEEADLVVAWGAGLEEGLSLDELDKEPIELARGESDPHVWMDPRRVARSLTQLTQAFADTDPDNAGAYRERAAGYADQLSRLDGDLQDALAAIPPERRKLVTSHDSLGHFARRYRLEFVGAPFGVAPEAEPSAETVSSLIDRIEEEDVPAVFADDSDDPELIAEIAREAGVEVVDDLLIESFSGRVDSYEEMLRYDAERIAEALAP